MQTSTTTRRALLASTAPVAVATIAGAPMAAEARVPGDATIERLFAQWRDRYLHWQRILYVESEAKRCWPETDRDIRPPVPERSAERMHIWQEPDGAAVWPKFPYPPHVLERPAGEAENEAHDDAKAARDAVLNATVNSPAGILAKLMAAFESGTVDDLKRELGNDEGDPGIDFAASILPDLLRMAGRDAEQAA